MSFGKIEDLKVLIDYIFKNISLFLNHELERVRYNPNTLCKQGWLNFFFHYSADK